MKAKPHRKLHVTRKLLWGEPILACWSGVNDVAALLPCDISTDPEENTDLAIALIESGHGERAEWLSDRAELPWDSWPDIDYQFRTSKRGLLIGRHLGRNQHTDLMLVAQCLAMFADAMLTRRGE